MVNETDVGRGGCEFDQFLVQAPEQLVDPPVEIFDKNMSIPLYTQPEYRIISLRKILCAMGATRVKRRRKSRRSSLLYNSIVGMQSTSFGVYDDNE